jgi:23S rRNA-intervening sequence protein
MNGIAALIRLTGAAAEALSEGAIGLEDEPGIRSRDSFRRQLGNAAIAVIAQVAQAQCFGDMSYPERVEAMSALRGARASTGELKDLVSTAVARHYVDPQTAAPVLEKADETVALLLAATVAARAGGSLPLVRRSSYAA